MKQRLCSMILQGAVLLLSAISAHANLILNGSFEDPLLPASTYQAFSLGSTIGAGAPWTVIGAPGNVAVVHSTYNAPSFPAQDLTNWLDLTGETATVTGVEQVVLTTPGLTYDLSFWVGNLNAFGPSTINVLVNGAQVLSATNGTPSSIQTWQLVTYQFTASSTSTTIGFLNGDPSGDQSNGLDNVQLVAGSEPEIPEPASGLICGGGLLILGTVLRKKITMS